METQEWWKIWRMKLRRKNNSMRKKPNKLNFYFNRDKMNSRNRSKGIFLVKNNIMIIMSIKFKEGDRIGVGTININY